MNAKLRILSWLLLAAWLQTSRAEEKNLLFQANFDKDLDANFSKGAPAAHCSKGLEITQGKLGKTGEAVAIRADGGDRLWYQGEGNFNPRKGAMLIWVKPDETKSRYFINLYCEKAGHFILYLGGEGNLILRTFVGDKMGNLESRFYVQNTDWAGKWHEVGFTYDLDAGKAQILVDGEDVATGQLNMPDFTGNPFVIGIGHFVAKGDNQFGGLIDDVRIYATPLPSLAQ